MAKLPKGNSKDLFRKDKKGKSSSLHSIAPSVGPTVIREDESSKKGSALAFAILSKEDSAKLLRMTAPEMENKLKEKLKLNPLTDLKDAACLDYYVGATYWAKQQDFSIQQLSGLFTVIHNLLNKIKDENATLVECVKDVCKVMVGIDSENGPDIQSGGIEFFSVEQAKAITDYIHNSLFQHFKLYEYMFSQPQDEEIVSSELSVEVPLPATTPFPPPLDEGIAEDVINEFLSIVTPSLSTESSGELKTEDTKPMTPIEIELPSEAADLFNKLTPEDVRSIVEEVSGEMLSNLQIGLENKIRTQENNALAKINKIHVVVPETPREDVANQQ